MTNKNIDITSGGVLSDLAILSAIREGSVVITPFNRENLTNCAYDVSLGNKVAFVPDSKQVVIKGWVSTLTETPIIDISDKDSIYQSFKKITFTDEDKGITIPPGGMMICHTNEFIGTAHIKNCPSLTTFMRARSTVARAGVTVSSSAGWGDVGYANRWGMVLHNTRKDASVFIPFGMKIAQIVFLKIEGQVSQCYSTLTGNYKTVSGRKKEFEKLDAEWDPESIIPKKSVVESNGKD